MRIGQKSTKYQRHLWKTGLPHRVTSIYVTFCFNLLLNCVAFAVLKGNSRECFSTIYSSTMWFKQARILLKGGDITEVVICLIELVCFCFHWMLINLWSHIFIHTLYFYIFLSKHGILLQRIDVNFFDLFLALLTIMPTRILMNILRLLKTRFVTSSWYQFFVFKCC